MHKIVLGFLAWLSLSCVVASCFVYLNSRREPQDKLWGALCAGGFLYVAIRLIMGVVL